MPTISIARTHHLSHATAKDVAGRLAKDLEQRFGLACKWDGDDVRFARSGVSGLMHVGTTDITLDIRLGLLLSPLRPAIEKEIHAQLDKLTGGATSV
jgi:putative polyhydroxyalkanoate system protein